MIRNYTRLQAGSARQRGACLCQSLPRAPRHSRDPKDSRQLAPASRSGHLCRSTSSNETAATPSTTTTKTLPQPSPDKGTSWQYLVAMCAISVVICYADRSNLSTAVLPMSEEFGWDKGYQGLVLSSFFAGYALTQILGGQLADKYGGKLVLASGVAIWSFFTWATPIVAAQGTAPLIAARVLLGVGEGVAFPAIHSLIARNVPYEKQSTAVGIVTAASYVGIAVAFGISPMIISEYGWHDVFYLFGGAALLWLPFWLPLQISDNLRPPAPATPSIANASPPAPAQAASEQATSSSETTDEDKGLTTTSLTTSTTTPGFELEGLKALLKRKEVWAICAAQYTGSWGLYGLLSWLPTFFSEYYGVPIEDLAGYTFLPYIVQGGTGMLAGVAADKLLSNGWKVRDVRVLLQSAGMLGPACCLLVAVSPLVGDNASLASNLITVGLGFSALTLGGVSVSHLDIAPRHAGVIFGAGNTTATLAGLISVPVTGLLLETTHSWPLVFGVTAAHYVLGTILWIMWVGDKQLPEDLLDSDAQMSSST